MPYEILLIDDESEAWLPVLGPAAQERSFHLLSAESVQEGLGLLKQYGALVDAVVLSLDVDGSREGLMRLKTLYPKLPVLLLAADVTARHFAAALEGVRLGAYDGFAKTSLDPDRLVEQVRQALAGHHPESPRQNASEHRDALYVLVETGEAARSPAVGYFAFLLDRIAAPRNADEQEEAVAAALTWHRSLLNVLALCDPDVRFHLRYAASPRQAQKKKKLGVALIAGVEGPTPAAARADACRLRQELRTHLYGSRYAGAGVYHFCRCRKKRRCGGCSCPCSPARPCISPAARPPATFRLRPWL